MFFARVVLSQSLSSRDAVGSAAAALVSPRRRFIARLRQALLVQTLSHPSQFIIPSR